MANPAEILRVFMVEQKSRQRMGRAGLGTALGVSPQQVDKYLSGQDEVPLSRLDGVAAYFDFSTAEELLGRARAVWLEQQRPSAAGED